jgi:hypothetical protein
MKILITESQYRSIVEHSMAGWSQGLTPKQVNDTVKGWDKGLNNHALNNILQIGTAFIPVVGPFISAGIGLLDAAKYHKEGKKTEAGIVALFSILPGLAIVKKMPGITQLGEKGMVSLGNKIINKQALTKVEQSIVNFISNNQPLIKSEASQLIKSLASNAMNKVTNVSNKKLFHVFAEKGLEHQLSHSASGAH